jgi:hypothetical protein
MLSLSYSFILRLYSSHHKTQVTVTYVYKKSLGHFCAVTRVIIGFADVDHSFGCGFVFI